jgi:hypothetical protein
VASGIVRFYHIPREINPSDVLSKHWGHMELWTRIRTLLFWRETPQINSARSQHLRRKESIEMSSIRQSHVCQSQSVVGGQRRSAWLCRILVKLSTAPMQAGVEIHAQSSKRDDLSFGAHRHSSENIAFRILTQSNTHGRVKATEPVKIEWQQT